MANKAFVCVDSFGYTTGAGVVIGSYVVLDDSSDMVANNSCSATFQKSATATTIASALAANVQDQMDDPLLTVIVFGNTLGL